MGHKNGLTENKLLQYQKYYPQKICRAVCRLTTMTVGSVGVRTAVDRASRIGGSFPSSSGQEEQNSGYDAQHQYQACYADADGEASLGNAYAVRCLKEGISSVRCYTKTIYAYVLY